MTELVCPFCHRLIVRRLVDEQIANTDSFHEAVSHTAITTERNLPLPFDFNQTSVRSLRMTDWNLPKTEPFAAQNLRLAIETLKAKLPFANQTLAQSHFIQNPFICHTGITLSVNFTRSDKSWHSPKQ
jgi:hypothetical protein